MQPEEVSRRDTAKQDCINGVRPHDDQIQSAAAGSTRPQFARGLHPLSPHASG